MIPKLFNLLTFCGIVLFSTSAEARATSERTKTFSYAISKEASVELNNQYGDIEVLAWEKDSIRIEVTIAASTGNFGDLGRLITMADVTSRGSESSVVVTTEWTSGSNVFKQRAMDLKKLLKTDKKLTIDYKVYMPLTCRLTIENRFGNVYLPNYNGALRVDLNHGDFRGRELKDVRSIAVKYGKVVAKQVKNGLLRVEFGSLLLDKAENLTLRSKSSTIEIVEVKHLAITSKNDDLRIDQVHSLRGESTFSHIRARKVQEKVDLVTNYGDVSLKEINQSIEGIRMNGTNTDYDLEFNADANYLFNVFMIGKKSLNFSKSKEITLLTQDMLDDENRYKGFQGNENATSKVNITAKNGYVSLYVR